MNIGLCLAEQEEYAGQFPKDEYGAYMDCDCSGCRHKRDNASNTGEYVLVRSKGSKRNFYSEVRGMWIGDVKEATVYYDMDNAYSKLNDIFVRERNIGIQVQFLDYEVHDKSIYI